MSWRHEIQYDHIIKFSERRLYPIIVSQIVTDIHVVNAISRSLRVRLIILIPLNPISQTDDAISDELPYLSYCNSTNYNPGINPKRSPLARGELPWGEPRRRFTNLASQISSWWNFENHFESLWLHWL